MTSPQIENQILPIDFNEFELRIIHDYPNRPPLTKFRYLELFLSRDDDRTRLEKFFEMTSQSTGPQVLKGSARY